jgi:hypothetical protein
MSLIFIQHQGEADATVGESAKCAPTWDTVRPDIILTPGWKKILLVSLQAVHANIDQPGPMAVRLRAKPDPDILPEPLDAYITTLAISPGSLGTITYVQTFRNYAIYVPPEGAQFYAEQWMTQQSAPTTTKYVFNMVYSE